MKYTVFILFKKSLILIIVCAMVGTLCFCDKNDDDDKEYPFDESLLPGVYVADKYFIDNNELDMESDLNLLEYRIAYLSDGSGYKEEKFPTHTKTDTIQWKMNVTKEYIHKRFSIGNGQWTEWITNQRILKLNETQLHVVFESNIEERKVFFIKIED